MVAIETRYGLLQVGDQRQDLIVQFLTQYGEWAWLEVMFVGAQLPPRARILDIGACLGTFGLGLENVRDDIGGVVYCEANPAVATVLEQNIGSLARAPSEVMRAVVTGSAPVMVGRMPDGNWGALSFADGAVGAHEVKAAGATTLSTLRQSCGPFDLIKIDAEGMENEILAADENHLRASRPLLWLECLEDARSLALAEWLLSLGYQLHYFAYSAFNPDNVKQNSARIFPIAFEAGLLASTSTKVALPADLPGQQFVLRPIRSAEDLRAALWETPRWGLPGWESLDPQALTAFAGRYFLNRRYENFLTQGEISKPLSGLPDERHLADELLLQLAAMYHARGAAEQAHAEAEAHVASLNARIEALFRGRTAFLTEIEALRLSSEEMKLAHEDELRALRHDLAAARNTILTQILQGASLESTLADTRQQLATDADEITALRRRLQTLEHELGQKIAALALV